MAVYFGALIDSLKRELTWYNSDGLTIHLYVNNLDPNSDTESDDFTEATATWYDPIDLDEWDVDGVTYDTPHAVGTHPAVTWTPDGSTSESVYGYYCLNSLGGLEFSEKFADGPFTIGPSSSRPLVVTPKRTRRSEFHST